MLRWSDLQTERNWIGLQPIRAATRVTSDFSNLGDWMTGNPFEWEGEQTHLEKQMKHEPADWADFQAVLLHLQKLQKAAKQINIKTSLKLSVWMFNDHLQR